MDWKEIYKNQEKIDEKFDLMYGTDRVVYEKNCIEFLVEFGEFLNETKCFKYWSKKEPEQYKILDELADCFTMTMYFYRILNLELEEVKVNINNEDIFALINETYFLGTRLYNNLNEYLIKEIYKNLLLISKFLKIEENEIIDAINEKQKVIEYRFNINY